MNGLLDQTILVTSVGITNLSELTDEELKDGLIRVGECNSIIDWLEADLVAEYRKRNPKAFESVESDQQIEFSFMRSLTKADVVDAIPIDHRNLNLSFSHHQEIVNECESLEEIDEWLAKAAEAGWTVSQLRKHLRSRSQDQTKTGKVTGKLEWLAPLGAAVGTILRKDPSKLKPDEKTAIIDTLSPAVKLYNKLKSGEEEVA